MGFSSKLAALRRSLHGSLQSFELANGRRHYYDPEKTFLVLFRYFAECLDADYRREPRPGPPPEVLRAVANARDRGAALERVMGDYKLLPVSREELIRRGQFVPHTLRASDREEEDASG